MTNARISNAAISDLAIRKPALAEVERVLHLFSNVRLHAEARLLAAVRSHPIERFIAAVAWWPEGTAGRFFRLPVGPGVDPVTVAGLLLDQLGECARLAGMATIQYASLLGEDSQWYGLLQKHGFECLHSERSFEVTYQDAWDRVMRLHQKHSSQIPAGWRTDSIRNHPGANRRLPS